MADTFDETYTKNRFATDQWQSSQLQESGGEGSVYNPFTSISIEANTDPGHDANSEARTVTDLKLAKPPTAETPAEVVTDQPIKSIDRKTITVDTPEVAAVRQQFKDETAKIGTGEKVAEEVGKAGKQVASALHPGLVVAGRAIGLDETQADALATGFVEFMGGLPGQEETDTAAGFETALAALPMVGAAIKGGKVVGKELGTAVLKEFAKAAEMLKAKRGLATSELPPHIQKVLEGNDKIRKQERLEPANLTEKQWELVTVPLDSLRGENWYQFKDVENVRPSSRTTGPILLDHEGKIIDGNHRVMEAAARGDKTIEVYRPLSDLASDERGSFQPLPGRGKNGKTPSVETPITWDEAIQIDDAQRAFDERLKTFSERVSKQRRGVRSDVQVTAESARPDAIQLESFMDLPPGTILKDSDVVAVKRMFKDLAEPVRQLSAWVSANPKDEQAFLALLQQMPKVEQAVGKIAGVYAESGRTQRLLSPARPTGGMIPAKSEEKIRISDPYIKQWLDFFKQQDALAKTGAPALTKPKLVQILSNLQSPDEFMAAAKVMAQPSKWDMFVEYWINGLLSSPATHVTNIVSNLATLAWAIPERQVAAMLSKEVRPSEGLAMLRGIVEAQGDAFRLAWKAFKTEESQIGHGKLEGPSRAITADALALTGTMGQAADLMGSMIRLPGRFLLSADDYFKAIAFRAEVRALAKREAYRMVTEADLHGKQAAREMQKIEQRILANPPDSIDDAAKEFAAYTTFTRDLGETGQKVQAALSTPVGRILVPFVRTPTNIFKYVGERTPLAFASSAVREEIAAGGSRKALALAKISLGSATMAYLGSLAAEGLITGGGPVDKELLKIKKQTGWQPYSIKVGTEYIALSRIEPFGSFLGIAADFTDLAGQLSQEDASKLASAIVVAISRNVSNKTFVKGLSGTLNAVTSQDINVVNGFLERELPTLLPASSLSRQLARLNDPVLREVDTIFEAFKSKIPGYSKDLPPTRNLWGEPILFEGGLGPDLATPLYTSEIKHDPVSEELVKQRIPVSLPERNIEKVRLTPQEYDAFQRLSGGMPIIGEKTLKEQLLEVIQSELYRHASDGPDGGKKALLVQRISDYRDMARHIMVTPDLTKQWLRTSFPDLVDRVQEHRAKDAKKFSAQ